LVKESVKVDLSMTLYAGTILQLAWVEFQLENIENSISYLNEYKVIHEQIIYIPVELEGTLPIILFFIF
jgi:hypothetical protein